jgi:signal transduction histidine kinase
LAGLICGVLVSLAYATISLVSVQGRFADGEEETTLLVRILAMFVVIAVVNLVARYEGFRRREAVAQAVELERQRVELSRTIHDTVAQTAYMISIGIETARRLANHSNQALINSLDATHSLAQSAIWEVQAPIDGGLIFQGQGLGQVVRSHAATFTDVTSIPASVIVDGEEPPLSTAKKALFFSIVHNALTNVIRHAQASTVTITLEFSSDEIRLSISDDGVGLPEGYNERGAGFSSMLNNAAQMGGRLDVASDPSEGGTTVTCWVPNVSDEGVQNVI